MADTKRRSDEQLADLEQHGKEAGAGYLTVLGECVVSMAEELIARRQADLTAEDIRVLRFLVVMFRESPEVYALVGQHPNVIAGAAVLDRITKEQG